MRAAPALESGEDAASGRVGVQALARDPIVDAVIVDARASIAPRAPQVTSDVIARDDALHRRTARATAVVAMVVDVVGKVDASDPPHGAAARAAGAPLANDANADDDDVVIVIVDVDGGASARANALARRSVRTVVMAQRTMPPLARARCSTSRATPRFSRSARRVGSSRSACARARLDDDAARMKREREAERAGRTRAERDVRALRLELARVSADGEATTTSSATSATDVRYALRALGTFRSAFRRRLGAPRQPSLVPLARGRVALHAHVPASALEGLEEFSHCWLLFLFHENTDFHASVTREIGKTGKTGAADGPRTTTRGKIRVPRLNGEKRGCLATRTPHRPCPIGLSLVEIVSVGERWLDVAGADVVNGSPILDVKPYVPYSDCNAEARAPLWVSGPVDDGGDGPLHVDEVVMTDAGELEVRRAWEAMKKRSLYRDADEFVAFTLQALGRDLRSYHQRLKPTPTSAPAAASVAGNGDEDHAAGDDIEWKCALDGVVVSYKHVGKRVFVVGAEKDTADDPDAYYTTSVK